MHNVNALKWNIFSTDVIILHISDKYQSQVAHKCLSNEMKKPYSEPQHEYEVKTSGVPGMRQMNDRINIKL